MKIYWLLLSFVCGVILSACTYNFNEPSIYEPVKVVDGETYIYECNWVRVPEE